MTSKAAKKKQQQRIDEEVARQVNRTIAQLFEENAPFMLENVLFVQAARQDLLEQNGYSEKVSHTPLF